MSGPSGQTLRHKLIQARHLVIEVCNVPCPTTGIAAIPDPPFGNGREKAHASTRHIEPPRLHCCQILRAVELVKGCFDDFIIEVAIG